MRNIRFRIKHESGDYVSVIQNSKSYMINMNGDVLEDYGDQYRQLWEVVFDADVTVQLATGVNDKYGVEIYEGDTVLATRERGDCREYPSYIHEDDKPEVIKCQIRWVDCGLWACWGHKFCNKETINSSMEVINER